MDGLNPMFSEQRYQEADDESMREAEIYNGDIVNQGFEWAPGKEELSSTRRTSSNASRIASGTTFLPHPSNAFNPHTNGPRLTGGALLQGIQFVAETGKSRPSGPARILIRSQARRTGNRAQSRVIPSENKNGRIKQKTLSPKTARPPAGNGEANFQLMRAPGKNALDPFKLLPVSNPDRAQELLHHYDCVFRHTYTPVYPREKWVSYSMSDPILLHATLTFAALSHSLYRGKASSLEAIYHQGKTIQLLKYRLYHDPKRMTSDRSICAVTCLTQFENFSAVPDSVRIHMDGLESMINSRGGLQGLEMGGIAMSLSTWADCAASIVMDTKPRFELLGSDADSQTDPGPYSSLSIRYKSKLFNLTGLKCLSEETIRAYRGICNLSALKEAASCYQDPTAKAKAGMKTYSDMVERLERQVIGIIQSDVLRHTVKNRTNCSIYRLFGNALLLHIYMFLRDMPRGMPLLNLLSSRVRLVLVTVDIQKLQMQYPEMMLWVLIMAGLGAIGTQYRGWYAKLLAETCNSMGILGGNEIAFTLSEFLWSELYRSPVTVRFWSDVAIAQGVETGYEVRQLTDHVSTSAFNAQPEVVQ